VKNYDDVAAFMIGLSSCEILNEDGKDLHSLISPVESQSSVEASLNPIQVQESALAVSRDSKSKPMNMESEHGQISRNAAVVSSAGAKLRARLIKTSVLLRRAAWSLVRRPKLWMGSLFMHALLAFVIMIVAGTVNPYINDTTAYIVLTTTMLTFMSVQFIFFLHKSNEVFLKEHSRGLYSYFAMWFVGSLPHYALKVLNAVLFAVIIYDAIGLNDESDRYEFYLLIVSTLCVIGGILTEIVVFTAPTIRLAYVNFPVVVFFLFYFSSIPVKPSTYVYWMKSWVPSVSVFRWTLQAQILNEFEGDNIFLVTQMNPVTRQSVTVDTFGMYLTTFGFGGKTREFCYGIVFLNLVIFRIISLIALRVSSHRHRGKRHLYKDEDFE